MKLAGFAATIPSARCITPRMIWGSTTGELKRLVACLRSQFASHCGELLGL
jgi:hypothetical protein